MTYQEKLSKLKTIVSKLRYVRDFVDIIEPSDKNLVNDACVLTYETLLEIVTYLQTQYNIDMSNVLKTLETLRAKVASLRYVRSGDIVLARDHNELVDAMRTIVSVFDELQSTLIRQIQQLETRVEELEELLAKFPIVKHILITRYDVSIPKPISVDHSLITGYDVSIPKPISGGETLITGYSAGIGATS